MPSPLVSTNHHPPFSNIWSTCSDQPLILGLQRQHILRLAPSARNRAQHELSLSLTRSWRLCGSVIRRSLHTLHTLHTFHTAHWWLSPSEKSQDRHFMRVAALVGSAAIAAFPPARAARNEDRDTVHRCKHFACTSAWALLAGQSALHTRGCWCTHNARVGGGVATAATNGYPT
jgi:hypothetical protein